jgi:hypothetical protein
LQAKDNYYKGAYMSIKIEDLRIGQKVFFNNIERTICKLDSTDGGIIYFSGEGFISENFIYSIELNAGSFSLTPPKKKKRYWIWKTKGVYEVIKPTVFMDEEGYATSGRRGCLKDDLIEKYEDDFVDVEE